MVAVGFYSEYNFLLRTVYGRLVSWATKLRFTNNVFGLISS